MNVQKGLTTKLHLCCTASYQVVFRLSPVNSRDAPKGRKVIESIHSKNNTYLLIDSSYENDKTAALAKYYGFRAVVHPKKILNPLGYAINNFINNEILLNDISFV